MIRCGDESGELCQSCGDRRSWDGCGKVIKPNEADLLPCPCCGGLALLCQWLDTLNPNAAWVECTICELMTDSVHHEDPIEAKRLAAAIWNRRTS